jgi:hypothetical protein
MSLMSSSTTALTRSRVAISVPALAVPVALYAVAFIVRLAATFVVTFPLSEGSAYYVAVARNIATGRGLVVDAIWSYATPPLDLPRAAFELWQPLASSLAAVPMWFLGPTFASAQLSYALVGAALAPLTWWIARDAANRLDLPGTRKHYVAAGAGLICALAGPLVLAAALPDSTLPFTVLVVAAAVAMPAAIKGRWPSMVALGLLLGLAYLTRMEAVWVGVVFVAMAWAAGVRGRRLVGRVGAVAAIGALVALPWWLRNLEVFGSPTPGGQLIDNILLTRNEQIFNWSAHPTIREFAAQGPLGIVFNIANAAWHNAVDVLAVPGNVVVVVGLLALVLGWHRRESVKGSPLMVLLHYGALVFVITTLAFPVATLWGTFEHAAGPLLVAFVVLAALGGDALVARVRAWRNWPRPNAGMAPAALAAVVVAMTALQLTFAAIQTGAREKQINAVAQTLRANGVVNGQPLITDHPLWLSDALDTPTLVMPQDGIASVGLVAQRFDAEFLVLVDGPPADASVATQMSTARCLIRTGIAAPADAPRLAVYMVHGECR